MVSSIDRKLRDLNEIDKRNSQFYEKLRKIRPSVPQVVTVQPSSTELKLSLSKRGTSS